MIVRGRVFSLMGIFFHCVVFLLSRPSWKYWTRSRWINWIGLARNYIYVYGRLLLSRYWVLFVIQLGLTCYEVYPYIHIRAYK